jgi:hypothetical protein
MNIYTTTTTNNNKATIFSMKSNLITTAAKDDRLKQHAALKMLTVLVFEYYNTKTGKCNPGDHLLMKQLKVSDRTIERSRAHLINLGYMSLTSDGQYNIHWDMRVPNSDMRVPNSDMRVPTENRYPSDSIRQSADSRPVTIEEPLKEPLKELSVRDKVAAPESERVNLSSKETERTNFSEETDVHPKTNLSDQDSNLHSKINCPVNGLDIPRGLLGTISPEHLSAFREWLNDMGLSKHCVNGLRYSAMIECYNDRTNTLIKSLFPPLSQHDNFPPADDLPKPTIDHSETMRPKGDVAWLSRGEERQRAMVNLRGLRSDIVDAPTANQITQIKPYYDRFDSRKASTSEISWFCHLVADATFVRVHEFAPTITELELVYFQTTNNSSLQWDMMLQQVQMEWQELKAFVGGLAAVRNVAPALDRFGSWPCENAAARRTDRMDVPSDRD